MVAKDDSRFAFDGTAADADFDSIKSLHGLLDRTQMKNTILTYQVVDADVPKRSGGNPGHIIDGGVTNKRVCPATKTDPLINVGKHA